MSDVMQDSIARAGEINTPHVDAENGATLTRARRAHPLGYNGPHTKRPT